VWGTLRREAEEVNNGPDPEAGGWEGDKKSMVSICPLCYPWCFLEARERKRRWPREMASVGQRNGFSFHSRKQNFLYSMK
jgi:predicted RNA-binding Zn ribbon-like protein